MVGKKVIDKTADAQSYIKIERENLANMAFTLTLFYKMAKPLGKGKWFVNNSSSSFK